MVKEIQKMTFEDRIKIETLLKEGKSLIYIAKELKRNRSTITREIRRATTDDPNNKTPTRFLKFLYRARQAQQTTELRRKNAGRPSTLNRYKIQILEREIHEKHYTPLQVRDKHPKLFSNTTIMYSWINRRKIPNVTNKDLPMQGKRFMRSNTKAYYKNKRELSQTRTLAKLHSINERPDIINSRSEFGHWEMDGVEGKRNGGRSLLITLVERKTRFQVAIKSKSKSSHDVLEALKEVNNRYGRYIKSITCDNGQEFTNSIVSGYVLSKFGSLYIANSYAPYERGTNERTNRNLRAPWYFPKGISFNGISQTQIDKVLSEINEKPLTHIFKNGLSPARAFKRYAHKLDKQYA